MIPYDLYNPAPQGLQLGWQNIGGEDLSGYSDLAKKLGGYLKNRRDQEMQSRLSQQGTAGQGGIGGVKLAPEL
jgi:hypothetical protein